MKHTKGKWAVSHPIYQGKKMLTKGSVTLSQTFTEGEGYKRAPWSTNNKICEFVEWKEKDQDNANLIASAPDMLDALKRFLTAPVYKEGRDHIGWCYLEGMERIVAKAEGK